MANADILVYESANHELHTAVDHFKQRKASVDLVSWRPDIQVGARITEGMPIADVFWDDGTQEVLRAPPGCAGTVVFANRHLAYHKLHLPPSQLLLRLA